MCTWARVVSNACLAALLMHGSLSAADPLPGSSTDAADPQSRPVNSPESVEVWVALSVPALASLPAEATEQRAALRERILEQQNDVMEKLVALGAVESGRLQQVSNALAVRLPVAAIPNVKKIDGVTAVRPVTHRNRIGD